MLHFTDGYGNSGRITDSLDVWYSGYWEDEVIDFVQGLETDEDVESAGVEDLDPETHVLVELPEEVPIVEIEREAY